MSYLSGSKSISAHLPVRPGYDDNYHSRSYGFVEWQKLEKNEGKSEVYGIVTYGHLLLICSQILDMNDSELEQLARHLGHDPRTHTEYYRLSHSAVILSKVCNENAIHMVNAIVDANALFWNLCMTICRYFALWGIRHWFVGTWLFGCFCWMITGLVHLMLCPVAFAPNARLPMLSSPNWIKLFLPWNIVNLHTWNQITLNCGTWTSLSWRQWLTG